MKIYVDALPRLLHECPFADFCKQCCDRFYPNGIDKYFPGSEQECTLLKVIGEDTNEQLVN